MDSSNKKLNCKPGDIAIVIESGLNLGKLVQVERVYVNGEVVSRATWPDETGSGLLAWVVHSISGPLWSCNVARTRNSSSMMRVFNDRDLRPIRQTEGADETLTWKALPTTRETERS